MYFGFAVFFGVMFGASVVLAVILYNFDRKSWRGHAVGAVACGAMVLVCARAFYLGAV
jgi:multisubunit Na+/H+ antiporter MnhB subunit